MLHTGTMTKDKLQNENSVHENMAEIIYTQAQDREYEPPKSAEQHVLSNDDLIEYMYQHVQFDEILFDSDPLYDHRQIYSYEIAHIEYGLYENIEATAAFNLHMQKEMDSLNIEDKNTQYMYNLSQPTSVGHNMSIQAIKSEIYNEEQNEIMEMNQENTRRTEEANNKSNENIMNIHNMDMSQEVAMMPVYIPIIEEHHGVMFANSSKDMNDTCFKHVLSDMDNHEELLVHEVNNTEMFVYKNQVAGSNTPMVEAVYFDTNKAKKVLFDREMYAQFEYDKGGNLKAMYKMN